MTDIYWECGTAYDFFVSLIVLHNQERFGLRPQWAAGVRSRLPLEQRIFLEETMEFLPVPFAWIHQLDLPRKNVSDVLDYLRSVPAEKRLFEIMNKANLTPEIIRVISDLQGQSSVTAEQLEVLRGYYQNRPTPIKTRPLQKMAEAFMAAAEFGEKFIQALESYYQVFFAEEEERIRPLIQDGLLDAQQLAAELPVPELMEKLSHGVSFETVPQLSKIHLIPSYWSTPLVFGNRFSTDESIMVFGCRPDHHNLIPGENVPELLTNTMKVLSDPTRLRILRYLFKSPDTPSGLARKLRLRAPTMVHHLGKLRSVGLVHIIISEKGDRKYALRDEALEAVIKNFQVFLETSEADNLLVDGQEDV